MISDNILDYIEQNLKRDLTLVELSQKFHYSPRQLYYYLHSITGMPIMSYIRKRKLINAAREIALGRKMYDVAVDYGFDTQAGFYKAFIQCVGCSPSEFRSHCQLRELQKINPKLQSVREVQDNMAEVEIRKMEIGDVKSLWENIFPGNTPEEVRERVQKNITEMDKGNCTALTASIDNIVIGTILVNKSDYVLYSNRGELLDLVVNPAFQKQGLGRKLFQESCVQAKLLGIDYITASCRGNGTEQFFRAVGMEQCGRIPGGILEPWGEQKRYDEYLFYKGLG